MMPDPNMAARPKAFLLAWLPDPRCLDLAWLLDPDAGQSITDNNPSTICLHVPHHVEEGIAAHLVRRWMTRFDHRKTSHASS